MAPGTNDAALVSLFSLSTDFANFSGVSFVDPEQVNVDWDSGLVFVNYVLDVGFRNCLCEIGVIYFFGMINFRQVWQHKLWTLLYLQ